MYYVIILMRIKMRMRNTIKRFERFRNNSSQNKRKFYWKRINIISNFIKKLILENKKIVFTLIHHLAAVVGSFLLQVPRSSLEYVLDGRHLLCCRNEAIVYKLGSYPNKYNEIKMMHSTKYSTYKRLRFSLCSPCGGSNGSNARPRLLPASTQWRSGQRKLGQYSRRSEWES